MYAYSEQMQAMERCSSNRERAMPEELSKIVTPLKLEVWQRELESFPDQSIAALILRGIRQGFRIGFEATKADLHPSRGNMVSASEHAEIVSSYLAEEQRQERIALVGTPEEAQELGIHRNPFGVMPK